MSRPVGGWVVAVAAAGALERPRQRAAVLAAIARETAASRRVLVVTPAGAAPGPRAIARELAARGVPAVELEAGAGGGGAPTVEGVQQDVLAASGRVVVVEAPATAVAAEVHAAELAAALAAERMELWSEATGLFTADPRLLPTARLLRVVGYDEAQELVTTGVRLFHPAAVAPLRAPGIPLLLRCASAPEREGTRIAADGLAAPPPVKGVTLRRGVTLISLQTAGMWRRVGFLAEVFTRFQRHGVSVDLVSTSETNLTVSLDAANGLPAEPAFQALTEELVALGRVEVLGPCAALTLVGHPIRSALHRLGPVLELFEEHKVHLLSLAENDVNLTFVVDEGQGERLLHQLHDLLVGRGARVGVLGPSWEELDEARAPALRRPRAWWWHRRDELLALARQHAPAYVYSRAALEQAVGEARSLTAIDDLFYAMKACSFPGVLRSFHDAGLGFECVSPGEVERVLGLFPGLDRRRLLFTPNFAPAEEYTFGFEAGLWVTLDNLDPLRHWPERFAGRDLLVRVDPGRGSGHHRHVRTGGTQSKFGVPRFELDELQALIASVGARVVGLHAHAGSGVLAPESWGELAELLAETADGFPAVEVLDVGGGLGVAERPGEAPLDLEALDRSLAAVKRRHPGLRLWLEPGRFLVARAGVLLARVTQTKGKGQVRYVGVETGMNSLIRPALYGAYHEIVNLTRLDEPATELADVVGPICETGDVLGSERLLPPCEEGDVLLIANVGAYGAAMSSFYNLRAPASELML